jgi:AraC-like DNA-binding protein
MLELRIQPMDHTGAAQRDAAATSNSVRRTPASIRRLVETTVPASVADEILAGARARGLDDWSIRLRCGMTLERGAHARTTLTQCVRLVRAAQVATRDGLLGFGRHPMPAGMFGATCQALLQCRDLRGAIDVLAQLYGAFAGGAPFHRDAGRVRLVPRSGLQARSPLYALALLYSCYRVLCWLAGRRLVVQEIALTGEPHPLGEIFADMFGCALTFRGPASHFAVAEYDLHSEVVRSAAGVQGIADTTLMAFLNRALERRLEQRIRSVVGDDLSRGAPSCEVVAQRLGMTPRVLAHRLDRIGLDYGRILQRLRCDIALALLDVPDRGIEVIALRAGFGHAAGLEREFRGQLGAPPATFRRNRPAAP